jgi:hypothetical protein
MALAWRALEPRAREEKRREEKRETKTPIPIHSSVTA